MTLADGDRVLVVVMAFNVLLRNPGALEPAWLYGGGQMDARGCDDITTPGVVTAMRQRADRAHVANGRHLSQAAEAGDLQAEPVRDAGGDYPQHSVQVFG